MTSPSGCGILGAPLLLLHERSLDPMTFEEALDELDSRVLAAKEQQD